MCRASKADDVDDPNAEPVDALTMGRMMALVAQQGGDLDVALEQVGGSIWDTAPGGGVAGCWVPCQAFLVGSSGHECCESSMCSRQRDPSERVCCGRQVCCCWSNCCCGRLTSWTLLLALVAPSTSRNTCTSRSHSAVSSSTSTTCRCGRGEMNQFCPTWWGCGWIPRCCWSPLGEMA